MSSPFAILDRQKKKNGSNAIFSSQPSNNQQLKRSSSALSASSSAFANVVTYKPSRESLKDTEKPTENTRERTTERKPVRSSLSSVLKAQSKFSGKSSVVSSKSISSITKKPGLKRNNSASAAITSNHLQRSLPWASSSVSSSFNIRSNSNRKLNNCVIDNNVSFRKELSPSSSNNNNSNSNGLSSIDTSIDGVELSDEQIKVLDIILNKRKNIFFTGSAGTGKSFLLKLIIKKLQTRYGITNIGVSAPTALAASNIGGKTIHRLFGIGLGKESKEILLERVKKKMDNYMVWRRMSVLIIDEISMLDSEMLEKLNFIAKKIKRSEKAFGGIQIIICGDFLQLPPVNKNNFNSINLNYCFKSNAWKEIVDENIILTKVFRQQGDNELIDILNSLRIGKIDYKIENKLLKLSRSIEFNDGIEPTELFPTRNEVEKSNLLKLNLLNGPEIEFIAKDISIDNSKIDEKDKKSLENLLCSEILKLKIGAQVMMLKNDVHNDLVNGQLGIIETFLTKPVLQSFNARFGTDYIPYKLEILKKIGLMILKRKELINDEGIDNLDYLDNLTVEIIMEIMKSFESKDELLPFVKFTLPNDQRDIRILIERSDFIPPEYINMYNAPLTRRQLPINLSWAMSIHKSQGQTLQRVKVDLRKIFEKGQLYVAISRCVSSKGLQVINFDRRKVFVDEEVISFYNSISK